MHVFSIFQIYFPENSKHRLANGHVDRIIPAIKNVFASRSGEASSARPFRIRCRKILCFHTEKVPLGGLIKLLIFNLFGKQVTVGAQGCERKGGRAKKWISMEWSERCECKTRLCKCRNRLFCAHLAFLLPSGSTFTITFAASRGCARATSPLRRNSSLCWFAGPKITSEKFW